VTAGQLLERLELRRPGYLPEAATPRPGGAGHALLALIAHYGELLDDALRLAPERQRLAFLDAMGATLLPPRPARVPLIFELAEDAPVDVLLPEDSEVAAAVDPALPRSLGDVPEQAASDREPSIFATDHAVSLARARLASVVSLVPAVDGRAEHGASLTTGFRLFDDLELVPHHLYLGHDSLFELSGSAEVVLLASNSAGSGGRGVKLAWEYLTGEGWLPFEPVIDQTQGLRADGEILLRKVCGPKLEEAEVDGVKSFWIRARVTEPLEPPGTPGAAAGTPVLDTVRASVRVRRDNLPLDAALANGLPVDTTKDFLPLGDFPQLGSSFVFACDEAFKRSGARIGIEIVPSTASGADASTPVLAWEYSAGQDQWATLTTSTEQLLKGSTRWVWFGRPDDWAKTEVAGEQHFWARVRLTAGTYGGPVQYTVADGKVQATNAPKPPQLARLAAAYAYETEPDVLEHALTFNGAAFEDVTSAFRWGRGKVTPFRPVDDRQPSIYLGFDAPLPVGLISLFAEAPDAEAAGSAPRSSPFVWEYGSGSGWSELSVLDETGGFRSTGMIQFIGPSDAEWSAGPGGTLRWIRARMKTAESDPEALPLVSLRLNAAWATNRRAVSGEVLGRSDGSPRLTMSLRNAPVLPGEQIEVQEWHGQGREWQSLFKDVDAAALRLDHGPQGEVTGVWVRWEERRHLHSSAPTDRHYVIERTAGLLQFGDGGSGRVPPPGAAIAASYHHGGGTRGNVDAGRVAQLYSAVPFVAGVGNPVAATGGAEAEVAPPTALAGGGDVRQRGAQSLRHRDRAVSVDDFAWIARGVSAEVAVARCLPGVSREGSGRPGRVTVVIAPAGNARQPQPSQELLRQVRTELAARAPAAVAGNVRVVGPTYRLVSVVAEVVVSDPERAAEIEEALRRGVDAYLHPLTGGRGGGGWRFGEAVPLSGVAGVIERTRGVAYATKTQLLADSVVHGNRVPIEPDRLPAAGRHLIKLVSEG
jgi:Baseplate J-like protein